MQQNQIVYYVAMSLDGFICGPDEDISQFVQGGNGVQQYLNDLQDFKTVIMGRKTYEFGYQYGLVPGQPAYPHMNHYIFSESIHLENPHEQVQVCKCDLQEIERIRKASPTNIYLCGGGVFAGWLLEHEQIDLLKVKVNPFMQQSGTRLFENSDKIVQLDLLECKSYEQGLLINTYKVKYD